MVGLVFMMGVSTMYYLGKQAAADIAVRGFAMVGNVAGFVKGKFTSTEPTSEIESRR